MEGKDKLDELLVSYLLDELNAEDDALVMEWLHADEQNRVYLEELKQTLNMVRIGQIVDKVNVDLEWNRFELAREGKEQKTVFLNEAERFGNEVIKEVGLKRKTNIYKTIALTAVAACVLLAIGLGWSLLYKEKIVPQTVARTIEETPVVNVPAVKNLVNNTAHSKQYQLQDGTIVRLYPKSELSFQEPFESHKRDLHLTGKAEFSVAKDRLKPFTVFSGDISTTALGTRFTVTAFENSNNIFVRLYEGKVVVKAVRSNQVTKKDHYLLPGQELVYNRPKERTSIWSFNQEPELTKSDHLAKSGPSVADDPSIPKYGNTSWYMFNNQSLEQVFDELADMYNAEIKYSKGDISRRYFIGTFNKSDSLESVLKKITKLNNLELSRDNNKYTIRKK